MASQSVKLATGFTVLVVLFFFPSSAYERAMLPGPEKVLAETGRGKISFSADDWRRQMRWAKAKKFSGELFHGLTDGALGPAVFLKSIYIDYRPCRNMPFGRLFISVMPPYGRSPGFAYAVGFVMASLGMCLLLIRCSVPQRLRWLGDIGAVYYLIYMLFVLGSIFFYAAENPVAV